MRSLLRCSVLGLLFVILGQPQLRGPGSPTMDPPPRRATLSAQEMELQQAHEDNLEDTSRLVKLSQELKWDLANNDRTVLSMATVKKMDEIERLIKRIRARVRRK